MQERMLYPPSFDTDTDWRVPMKIVVQEAGISSTTAGFPGAAKQSQHSIEREKDVHLENAELVS